jgi:membrane-associated phospholipid phosphatase
MQSRAFAILIVLGMVAGTAHADTTPWYRGKYGKNRVTHMAVTLGVASIYLANTTVLQSTWAPDHCRWCEPGEVDLQVRDTLVWTDTDRAGLYSGITAYVIAPISAISLLVLSDHDASAARLIDDVLPVLETVAISQVLTQIVKFTVGRQRPYVRFETDAGATVEDNVSFWSGHSALGFGITTSAGMIAHWRGYWTEPYIWGVGITLSLATEYLRMAADKHYLTDVLVGGLAGVGAGLLVPRLMRRDLKIVPVNNGAAVAGSF